MRLVAECIPLFVAGKMLYLRNKEWLNFENCMLLLQSESGEVNMILDATIHLFRRRARRSSRGKVIPCAPVMPGWARPR